MDQPFFAIMRQRMSFLSERQKVLAENVANASTPKYKSKDLDEKSFNESLKSMMPTNSGGFSGVKSVASVGMVKTSAGHISNGPSMTSSRTISAPDSETTIDGNSVVLEEQMIKVADTRMNYDIAIGLYQKGLNMMRLAAKKPAG